MSEHETNPQRPSEEQSHRPVDASPENNPERGQSDVTAQQPAVIQPAAPQSAIPLSGAPQSAIPQSGIPQSAAPQSGAPQQPGGWPGSPWQHTGQHPAPQFPHGGQPYQAAGPQQPYAGAYPGRPQYPSQGPAGLPGTWVPGGEVPPQSEVPSWAQAVGTETRQPARTGGGRKVVLAGAAAILIALAAGGVGAATALAFSDDAPGSVQTSNSSVTRVVDHSSMAAIVAAVKDSVVSITTGTGEGSGVVLTADGYIVTNNHVVATAQGDTVTVIFADGKKADAKIVGTDPRTDLAVIKAEGVSGLTAAKFGSSANMQVGDTVLALGSPLGLEGSVTEGIVSAKDRTIRAGSDGQQAPQNPFGEEQPQQQSSGATSMSGLLQTDAPINPGNSGGALVNTNGEVIGINSAIATSGSGSGNIGLGFAIPSDKARAVAEALMKGEKVSHPALGVSVTEAEGGGALVKEVSPDSGAAKAGIEQGDVIHSVNGKAVNDSDDLVGIIQGAKVGDKVTIDFTRNGQRQTVNAVLAESA
ncbi:trypsin-like peptidase domain-containing protein [Amorphoplanes digitatis]|uniref:Putative serine protease PepD n=1 Tax=Actinoplanes digitatis TaxID=1868 RepID=A0A7W7HSQ9_9ACTN|nr:trypsin-like peptidase domain-containing protein [Actinoplanes digitatis]MBB4760082.1 putative serine protease PepD [Actinoplanes digitatis]